VVFFPSKPRHFYYFNGYTRRYWGRFDRQAKGYSKLAEADQRELVSEITETAFPPPGKMPPLPESTDGVAMDPPPEDLPPDESEEISAASMRQLSALPPPGKGVPDPPRQIYSGWTKQDNGTFSSNYHCQPKPGGPYKSHRVIYDPAKPKQLHYYNPSTKKYWGRYDLGAKGYSLLADKDKAEKLEAIAESAFPAPGPMPPIPGSDDKVPMLPPPTDLPE